MIKSQRLQDILSEVEDDPDPLNLTPEVHALRMLTIDYINRYEEYTEALLSWHQSWTLKHLPTERVLYAIQHVLTEWEIVVHEDNTPTPKQFEMIQDIKQFLAAALGPDQGRPRQVLDISEAKSILAETGKMVERIEKIRAANAISRPELNRVYSEMWRVICAWVTELPNGKMTADEVLLEIKKGLLSICV